MFYTQQQQRKQFTTAYQVLVLFCRQDFGNSGQKSFRDFGNDLGKSFPRFWLPLNKAFKTLDTFQSKVLTTLELLPQTKFPVQVGSKE